jgi:endonuclease/exonuclease/phosphatase family metal-dependent hydrolase
MKYNFAPLWAATLLAVAGTAASAEIEVMTQNQYVGTDLIGLVESDDFNAATIAALRDRAKSMPTLRARALAALIGKRGPALVGLQEVYDFTCRELPTPVADGKGCDNPSIAGAFTDQLADTLAALGGRYRDVATVVNLNLPEGLVLPDGSPLPVALPGIPVTIDGMTIYLGVVDRDVILARSDVAAQPVPYTALCPLRVSGDGCNYQTLAYADLDITVAPGVTVTVRVNFERGFVGVDAMVGGAPYRFVNTHLETRLEGSGPQARFIQSAQAAELLASMSYIPTAPGQRTLVVGDMNSDPRDSVYPVPPGYQEILGVPPYQQFARLGGFTDVWTRRPGVGKGKGAPLVGLSCCQYPDLSNRRSDLYERVDLIFSLAPPKKVFEARLLGESVADKTSPKGRGLWPSDHASVAARLQF